jgi:hypothetical protein
MITNKRHKTIDTQRQIDGRTERKYIFKNYKIHENEYTF